MAYMGSYTKETDKVHFLYKGTQGTQDDTADIGNAACKRYEFIAQYSGQYQIYVGSTTNENRYTTEFYRFLRLR